MGVVLPFKDNGGEVDPQEDTRNRSAGEIMERKTDRWQK